MSSLPVEPPARVVGHEHGVLRPVNQRVSFRSGVVDIDGGVQARLPVDENALSGKDTVDLGSLGQLNKNRYSRKIDSRRLFSRE